jgi:hypothetical protein
MNATVATPVDTLVHPWVLVPAPVLHTHAFAILATLVAINTVMYAALTAAKLLPPVHPREWLRRANRRAETRSIYPDGPA